MSVFIVFDLAGPQHQENGISLGAGGRQNAYVSDSEEVFLNENL